MYSVLTPGTYSVASVTSRAVPCSLFWLSPLQVSPVSNFRPDTRGPRWPLVQPCCGEGGALQASLASVGSARSAWATLGVCFPGLYRPGSRLLCRGSLKQALGCTHSPGLSCSGSGSRVLHKGADSVGPAFCALSRSKQLRRSCLASALPQLGGESYHLPGHSCPVSWVRSGRAVCLLWGADLCLRPSWQMSTVQDPRKT